MNNCLDTNILIDLTRNRVEAFKWLASVEHTTCFVPGIAAMELIAGARDKVELKHLQKFLDRFAVVWPTADELEAGFSLLISYRLSHGLDTPDAIIAASCLQRSARLFTHNLKHFEFIPGLDVQRPYVRGA